MPSDYEQIDSEIDLEEVAANAIETLSRLYADKTHFIYELIQNADDVQSRTLTFQLDVNAITVWNRGRPFNPKDVRAIRSVGESIKDLTQIGTHGIGFKAVYLWTDSPHIYSGDERFRIERYIHPVEVAQPSENIRRLISDGHTVFLLPFKPHFQDSDRASLQSELGGLKARTLLFLHHLDEITWRVGPDEMANVLRRTLRTHPELPEDRAYFVDLLQQGQVQETFLVFRLTAKPPQDVIDAMVFAATAGKDKERIERSRDKEQPIEIAFAYQNEQIVPQERSILFSYLPTDVGTGLKFLIQARYQTTPARDNIAKSDNSIWNRWLIAETSRFLAQVLTDLRAAGLLTPSLFSALPNSSDLTPHENVAHVFDPIRSQVLAALRDGELIPTNNGGHGRAQNVFYPHSQELVALFDASELTENSVAAWLHSGIRWAKGERTGTLARDAGVTEWTAHDSVEWLQKRTPEWFAARGADWLNRLYEYLAQHEKEWNNLRAVPLLRLDDGTHVRPDRGVTFFRPESGTNTEMLTPYLPELPVLAEQVNPVSVQTKVRRMLENLGVRALRPTEFIELWLLEQHRTVKSMEANDLHTHLRLLAKVWESLSQAERDRLLPELRESFWLHVYQGKDLSQMWITTSNRSRVYLSQIYTSDPDLESYFTASPEVYFLDPDYADAEVAAETISRLLRAMRVGTLPKRIKTDAQLHTWTKQSQYRNYRMVENWDLDGLTPALASINQDDAAHSQALSLWRILRRLRQTMTADYFLGKFTWRASYSRRDTEEKTDAKFVTILRESKWLPDENGILCAPGTLYAPTNTNKNLFGTSVQYLHSDFDVRDNPDNTNNRQVASLLGINLRATYRDVIHHLKTLSGTAVELAVIIPLYQFLEHQDRTVIAEAVKGMNWIYTVSPEPRWWRTEAVYWKDESGLFGEVYGYLSRDYQPTLHSFFVSLGVDPAATFAHCAWGVQKTAKKGDVAEQTRTRLDALYRRLWRDVQDGLSDADDERLWQTTLAGAHWLGKRGEEWGFYTREELVREDNEYTARLFRNDLPFWSLAHADSFGADILEIEPSSKARMVFQPQGVWEPLNEWTSRLRSLAPHIKMLLASETLNIGRRADVSQEILDHLHVYLTEDAIVTYELKGSTVTDPKGRPSHLDASLAAVWLRSDAHPEDYSILIGEALEDYFGTSRLQAFVSDLLPCVGSPDRWISMLERWHRRGLNYNTPQGQFEPLYEQKEGEAADGKISEDFTAPPGEALGEYEVADANWYIADDDNTDASGPQRNGVSSRNEMGSEDGSHSVNTPLPADGSIAAVHRVAPTPAGSSVPPEQPIHSNYIGSLTHGGHWSATGSSRADTISGSGPGGHGSEGGTGSESQAHLALKMHLARNPLLLGQGLKLVQVEYPFGSLDKADILLLDTDGSPVTVEIETNIPEGNYVGVWQAVKYQHLAAMEFGRDCATVRTVVIAPHFPESVKSKCRELGVEWFVQAIPHPTATS